jgi:hypothetical protein
MAQVTLYIDKDTAAKLSKAAKQAGLSRSRWLSKLIQQKTATEWPAAVKELAGAWDDLETAPGLRRGTGRDTRRARF